MPRGISNVGHSTVSPHNQNSGEENNTVAENLLVKNIAGVSNWDTRPYRAHGPAAETAPDNVQRDWSANPPDITDGNWKEQGSVLHRMTRPADPVQKLPEIREVASNVVLYLLTGHANAKQMTGPGLMNMEQNASHSTSLQENSSPAHSATGGQSPSYASAQLVTKLSDCFNPAINTFTGALRWIDEKLTFPGAEASTPEPSLEQQLKILKTEGQSTVVQNKKDELADKLSNLNNILNEINDINLQSGGINTRDLGDAFECIKPKDLGNALVTTSNICLSPARTVGDKTLQIIHALNGSGCQGRLPGSWGRIVDVVDKIYNLFVDSVPGSNRIKNSVCPVIKVVGERLQGNDFTIEDASSLTMAAHTQLSQLSQVEINSPKITDDVLNTMIMKTDRFKILDGKPNVLVKNKFDDAGSYYPTTIDPIDGTRLVDVMDNAKPEIKKVPVYFDVKDNNFHLHKSKLYNSPLFIAAANDKKFKTSTVLDVINPNDEILPPYLILKDSDGFVSYGVEVDGVVYPAIRDNNEFYIYSSVDSFRTAPVENDAGEWVVREPSSLIPRGGAISKSKGAFKKPLRKDDEAMHTDGDISQWPGYAKAKHYEKELSKIKKITYDDVTVAKNKLENIYGSNAVVYDLNDSLMNGRIRQVIDHATIGFVPVRIENSGIGERYVIFNPNDYSETIPLRMSNGQFLVEAPSIPERVSETIGRKIESLSAIDELTSSGLMPTDIAGNKLFMNSDAEFYVKYNEKYYPVEIVAPVKNSLIINIKSDQPTKGDIPAILSNNKVYSRETIYESRLYDYIKAVFTQSELDNIKTTHIGGGFFEISLDSKKIFTHFSDENEVMNLLDAQNIIRLRNGVFKIDFNKFTIYKNTAHATNKGQPVPLYVSSHGTTDFFPKMIDVPDNIKVKYYAPKGHILMAEPGELNELAGGKYAPQETITKGGKTIDYTLFPFHESLKLGESYEGVAFKNSASILVINKETKLSEILTALSHDALEVNELHPFMCRPAEGLKGLLGDFIPVLENKFDALKGKRTKGIYELFTNTLKDKESIIFNEKGYPGIPIGILDELNSINIISDIKNEGFSGRQLFMNYLRGKINGDEVVFVSPFMLDNLIVKLIAAELDAGARTG